MSYHDDASLFKKLRAETIGLLGFDPAALTTAQGVKVDLVSSLRLAIDTFQAQQLRGEAVDVGKLLSASEALARLLPKALTIDADAHKSHLESARAKFHALIEWYANELDRVQDVEIAALKAEVAALQTRLSEKDAVISALGGQVAAASPAPPASPSAANAASPSPPPPLPPPASPPRSSQPPLRLSSSTEPYLQRGGGSDVRGYDRWSNRN